MGLQFPVTAFGLLFFVTFSINAQKAYQKTYFDENPSEKGKIMISREAYHTTESVVLILS